MSDQFFVHGAFSWCELMTTDVKAAKKFYSELFGWELEDQGEIMPGMPYSVISAEDEQIGGIMGMPKSAKNMKPMWGSYVTVEDVDIIAETAVELGGKLIIEPTDVPGVGRICMIQDPQGAIISAITYDFEDCEDCGDDEGCHSGGCCCG